MKKSIKYAGIAAATLLAVAPVAAPALASNVSTTVKADTDPQMDQNAINQAVKDFGNQFKSMDASDLIANLGTGKDVYGLGSDTNSVKLSDFQNNGVALMDNNTASTSTDLASLANSDARDAKVYVVAKDAKGNVYDGGTNAGTAAELSKALQLDSQLPVTFTVYLNYKKLDGNTYTGFQKAAEFTADKSDDADLTSVNAKFTTPINVAKNSKTLATQLVSTSGLSVVDQNGDSLSTDSISMGDKFYYTYADAINAKNGDTTVTDATADKDVDGSEFKTAGTYYQTVTYNSALGSSLSDFIDKYKTDPSSYAIYVNGKKASAGYDFTPVSATATTGATITFVRAINVSDSEAEWTTTDTKGVVTTKSDHAYYTLKDDEGNAVTNRALAKNTAWKTNAVRTDQNGNKQYRVGGSEWIDANDVTFSDKATDNNNGEGAYTDVKALNGKVVTAGPSGFYYPLYNDNGKMISDRGVAGLSAWYTDKSAVNADGVTVYHVATGEWLQGTNATYTAY